MMMGRIRITSFLSIVVLVVAVITAVVVVRGYHSRVGRYYHTTPVNLSSDCDSFFFDFDYYSTLRFISGDTAVRQWYQYNRRVVTN